MADHPTISTESDLASPTLPTTAVTRRSLLGGAGIAVGAAVLASPPSMPGIATAAAQPVSADLRPLDAAFKRRAFEVREVCARNNEKIPIAPHPTNGDEARYTNKIGSDSRGLAHDKRGEVEQAAWQALYAACQSGDPADFEKIPLGGTRKLVNPVGTQAVSLSGINPTQIAIPAAPALASAERGGEAVEVYWQSLLRDVPLTELRDDTSNRDVLAATEELNKLADFRGPKSGGRVTPGTLFRANVLYFDPTDPKGRSVTPPGVLDGPLISQFLLRDAPYAAQWISAQIRTALPANEFLTEYEEWLAIQNGAAPKRRLQFDATPRYITTGRDLAEYIHTASCTWMGGSTDPCDPRRWRRTNVTPGCIRRQSPCPTRRTRIGNRKPKALGVPPSGCPMCRHYSPRGSVTPSAHPTGRSISCTGLCDRKPTAVWRTIASPMA